MENRIRIFVISLLSNIIFAQVGINTTDPKATLDINGNLKIRDVTNIPSVSSNHTFLVRDKTTTTGDFEIKEINSDILVTGNANAYYASKSGSWSLIDLGLGNSWARINLTGSADTKLGNPALFNTGVYTAQQAGTYSVYYEFQFASGVNLEVLGGKRLGILKNNAVWDEKIFDGVRLVLLTINIASLPITSTKLSSIVQLNAGDTLTFAVNTSGLLPADINLLGQAKVNVYIYKISN
ncbi:MAG: hypothetical protein E2590_04705 [Chryseobacterium sp.]|uniref:hypothetical protein n=1 Tax=Epilithonimonas caeni TaxID=365343 RepID=UPI0004171124|nr:hypothetical protein [Epilithonimonas caeni]MPS72434.1 hypothetical protein [Chryseobacterium sp.]